MNGSRGVTVRQAAAGGAGPGEAGRAGSFSRARLSDRAQLLFGVAVSLVSLFACVWWALGQPAPTFPTSPSSLALLAAAFGVLCVALSIRGFRWSVIIRRAGIKTEPAEPYALTLVGYMGNTVLPLRGGEILRVVLLRERSSAGWAGSIGSIIPERVLDVVTLAIVFVALVVTGVVAIPGGNAAAAMAAGVVAALLAVAAGYQHLRRRGRLGSLATAIRPFAEGSRLLLTPVGRRLGALSLLIWILDGIVFWLVARSLSLSISPAEGVGLAVVAAAFSSIPAGPAYAGTYDAAVLFSLAALDVSGGAAVSYVILVRFIVFVPITIAGLAVVVLRYGGIARLRARLRHHRGREYVPIRPTPAAKEGDR